jgi:hypothetical protein
MITVQTSKLCFQGDHLCMAEFHQGREPLGNEIL